MPCKTYLWKEVEGNLGSSPHNLWPLNRTQIWPTINLLFSIRKRFINVIELYRQHNIPMTEFDVQEINLLIFFDKNNLIPFKCNKNCLMFYVIKAKQFLLIFTVFKQFKNVSFKFWMLSFSLIFWFVCHLGISLQLVAIQWCKWKLCLALKINQPGQQEDQWKRI